MFIFKLSSLQSILQTTSTERNISQTNVFWTVSTLLWNIHQGFASIFLSDSTHLISKAGRENFPLFSFEHFRLWRKFIYISVVIQILWNLFTFHGRPLSITKSGPFLRITSQLNSSDDLHSYLPSFTAATFARSWNVHLPKISVCLSGRGQKGSVNIVRFCFRILQISSPIPDWTVINLNFKFSILFVMFKWSV